MHHARKHLLLLTVTLLLPVTTEAQNFFYTGTITFLTLSGKDCGDAKAGDTRPYQLTVEIQGSHLTGYSRFADLQQFSGDDAHELTLIDVDPQGKPDRLIVQGLGDAALIGEFRGTELRPDEAGCFLTRGKIEARQSATGQPAAAQQQEHEQSFQALQQEASLKRRDPQSYDAIVRLLPEMTQAETQGSEQPAEALRLREQLQPHYDKLYGADSQTSYYNFAARASLHEQLQQFESALPLRRQVFQLAINRFPQGIAVAAYNLGDVLEKLARREEALAAFIDATQADEKQFGPDHPEVATDLQRQAKLLEAMQQQSQAVALYQRILAIREKTPDARAEDIEHARNQLVRARDPQTYAKLEQLAAQLEQAKSKPDLNQAVALRLQMRALAERCYGKPSRYLANLLVNQADDLETLSRDQEALELYPQALAISEASYRLDHLKVALVLNNYGYQLDKLGRYQEALPLYQRALGIREKVLGPEHTATATSLSNLAGLYRTLGQYDEALPLYQRALAIHEKVLGPEHADTATSLNNLAGLYETLGQYDQALPLYQRALAIDEKALGAEHPGTAIDLNNLAGLYRTLGQYDQAMPLYQRALAIHEKVLGLEHAATATSLSNLAGLYGTLGQYDQAMPLYQRALRISQAAGVPDTLKSVQGNLAALYVKQHHAAAAIFFYKQAVNTLQQLRRQSAKLERGMQQSLLKSNEASYQQLSGLLMDAGRIAEAQQVLAMLKEDEYFDFIQRSAGEPGLTQRASYNGVEAPWAARFQEVGGQLGRLGKEIGELRKKSEKLALNTEEQSRLSALEKDMEVAGQAFDAAMNGMLASLKDDTARDDVSRQIDETGSRQELLGTLGQHTVLLQYLPLPDRLSIIVTTPMLRIARFSEIDKKSLNQKITAYRELLKTPRQDPGPLARELYQLLIAPVAADLQQADARQIMLSLNGALRYLPFTALHDGQRYLVENYALSLYNEAAADKLDRANAANWKVWGLGVTRAHENFAALPGVRGELAGIVGQNGVTGETWLDDQFTEQTLKDGVGNRYPVLHIASHFKFTPGAMRDSYLLLGDGAHLTLQDVRARLDLKGVDLVTLSACETAFGGGRDANGREVEGMGAMMQKKGAKSVLATLWPVADASTAQLMQSFYQLRNRQHLNKAEALRQAQLALLHGGVADAGRASRERGPIRKGAIAASSFTDPKAPYTHPYYWAPFILMGNWL